MSEDETEDEIQIDYLQIMDSQLNLISAVLEFPDDMYDDMAVNKVKAVSAAFKILLKTQKNLLEAL